MKFTPDKQISGRFDMSLTEAKNIIAVVRNASQRFLYFHPSTLEFAEQLFALLPEYYGKDMDAETLRRKREQIKVHPDVYEGRHALRDYDFESPRRTFYGTLY